MSIRPPFVCVDCPDKVFKKRNDYNRHLRIHDPASHVRCPFAGCTRTFPQKCALKTHMNTHTGEKPHACPYPECDKRFGDPSSRSRHVSECHHKQNPNVCPFPGCHSVIQRRNTFKKHLLEAHNFKLDDSVATKRRRRVLEEAYASQRSHAQGLVPSLSSAVATTSDPMLRSLPDPDFDVLPSLPYQLPAEPQPLSLDTSSATINYHMLYASPHLSMDPRSMTNTPEPRMPRTRNLSPMHTPYWNSSDGDFSSPESLTNTSYQATPLMTPNLGLRPTLPSPVSYPEHLHSQSYSQAAPFKQALYENQASCYDSQPLYLQQSPASRMLPELNAPLPRHDMGVASYNEYDY